MTAQVVVLIGPARSGKTLELVGHYRAALESNPGSLDRTLWLAPTGRTAANIRERLVGEGLRACLRPGVVTFDDLATQILDASGARSNRLGNVAKRELLRCVVAQALDNRTLSYFADAATRPGFVQLLAEHIAELKRRDVRPDARVAAPRRSDPKWTELTQLFLDYESQLLRHGLVDQEGALQAARDALAKHACTRFQNLELVVVDGFTDFTRVEHDVLRHLSKSSVHTCIALPSDANLREDLFATTSATLNQLHHDFPQLEVRELAPRPLPCPAIDFIAENIFRHPKHVAAPPADALDSLPKLEIVEAAGAQDEINQIARRIKKLLAGGTANPRDILVVSRSLADAAPRIREVFARFGIPYVMDAGQPVIAAPLVRTLLALLRLDREDWPFRRVVSVLTNNSLFALDATSRRAADWLIRDLQIAAGRNALLNRIQSLAADATSPRDRGDHLQRRVDAATAALPCLTQLAAALDELPETATLSEWCQSLSTLATNLGVSPFSTSDVTSDALIPSDRDAWHSLLTHFNALERLDTWVGQKPRNRSRSELLSLFLDISTNERLPRNRDDAGRVRVVAAPAARTIAAKHLFLAGMSEQAFPSPERTGNVATEADYRDIELAAHGKAAGDRHTHPTRAQGEMLLFYEVISRAEESLTISYPALDDKAQTLPPSPYVIELDRVIGEKGLERIPRTHPQLSPVDIESEPHSVPDWRVEAVARAIKPDGDRRLLAGVFGCPELQPLAGAIDAGLRIVHARARGESFGPAEGLLASPAIAERLAQRFGPKHAWSASQWETYAACPFRFFMQEVLGLEPLGDLVLETDFARRGSRLHDVLAAFHRDWIAERRETPIAADDEAAAFLAHLKKVIHDRTSSVSRVGVDAALLELDRRQILKWANRHYDDQAAYHAGCTKAGAAMTPAHFEFRFGSARRGDAYADPASTSDAFVIEVDGERIQITGQIDRIDVGEVGGEKVFTVIDYKSGRRASLKQEQVETGQQLQLPIYVEAAQALLFPSGAVPLQAGYWGMGSGFDSRGALAAKQDDSAKDRWKETQSVVRRLISEFIRAIRHGDFPVASRDDKCTSTCDFHMTCRVSQVRSLNKAWWPEIDPQSK